MVMGAPLDDARHLAQRYHRMRQEAESQAIEVSKHQSKVREARGNSENVMKLEAADAKLQESRIWKYWGRKQLQQWQQLRLNNRY
ncbi:hypothetical protein RchiOBHm_Chr2g0102681 [Rosa chinensis]|uniref:Uncharacterized protein n=1 Tax=Rosa chinensis TaxID=74649 RepID=A0A2P6RMP2_ROSCH|nr:hypothetical protein RchiOBHm_Chr2g0102681 [Rosa chinensis]